MAVTGGNVRTLIILEKNRTETSKYDNIIIAFCGAQRTLMRFRADAMQYITDAPKRSILLFNLLA